jgi:hypothetical protein
MCTSEPRAQTDGDKVECALRQPEGGYEVREERKASGAAPVSCASVSRAALHTDDQADEDGRNVSRVTWLQQTAMG